MRLAPSIVVCLLSLPAQADPVAISSVGISKLGKANLCTALGGAAQPPTITIRHAKAAGEISLTLVDYLSNGNTVQHGSTSVAANPSGTTVVKYAFLPPCNQITFRGVTSRYTLSITSGGANRTLLWGTYP